MRKFKFIGTESQAIAYGDPIPRKGIIYTEDSRISSDSLWGWMNYLGSGFWEEWQEVFEEEKVQLTETEKIVLIDFLNDHFEDLGEFINGVNTSDQNYNNLEGQWSYNKISNLIDKIEKL